MEHDLGCAKSGDAVEWRAAIDRLKGAYSDHTLRGYRSDFEAFERWCLAETLAPAPATPQQVANFIASQAAHCSGATLKRRLSSIRKIHRLLRLPCPVDDEDVAIALRRALRSKRRRPGQALGITAHLRNQLIGACPDTLIGSRTCALIAVGYDTLCRRSELVALRVEDITRLANGAATILVRRAKNDPFGDGRRAHITPTALQLLDAWLERAPAATGPIFRPIYNRRVGTRTLDPVVINRAVKALARQLGLPHQTSAALSGHSLRVGAAQDLMTSGKSLVQIMSAGGWTSVNVVGRYVREAEVSPWA